MKASKAFWAAFWSGIAAPGMLFAADCPKITRIEEFSMTRLNDTESLRSDWVAIGGDFTRVIESKENTRS